LGQRDETPAVSTGVRCPEEPPSCSSGRCAHSWEETSISSRISDSRYRRCPPRVRIEESLPAFAHRVTVLGSTRNNAATSEGVSSFSELSPPFMLAPPAWRLRTLWAKRHALGHRQSG